MSADHSWSIGMRPTRVVVFLFWFVSISRRLSPSSAQNICLLFRGSPFPCPLGSCTYYLYPRLKKKHDEMSVLSHLHDKCSQRVSLPRAWTQDRTIPGSCVFPTKFSSAHQYISVGWCAFTPSSSQKARRLGRSPQPPVPLQYPQYGAEYPVVEKDFPLIENAFPEMLLSGFD